MITAAAARPTFPGAGISRTDLETHLQQIDREIKHYTISDEARTVYGDQSTLWSHKNFQKSYAKYNFQGNTLGDIETRCNQKQMELEVKSARLDIGDGATIACAVVGIFTAIGGGATIDAGHPLIGAAVGLAGAGLAAFGIWHGIAGPSHYDGKRSDIERFKTQMHVWGEHLATAGVPAQPAAGVPTGALSTDEKEALAQQLLREVEKERAQKSSGKVERKGESVEVNGVSIPVKKPGGSVASRQGAVRANPTQQG